jgi:hypothetical protein
MFAYVDESGDLGFNEGSSRYFIITILKTKDEKPIRRCIKRIRQRKLGKKLKQVPELKGNNTPPHIRKKLLKELAELDIEIRCLVLRKEKVYPRLRDVKFRLYNYVAGKILPGALAFNRNVHITMDRLSQKKIIREDFDSYIRARIEERTFFPKTRMKISHLNSKNSPGLQACDFVSWSIFRKYETGDETYYNLIERRIKEEYELFK